jgi:hypothetical protein
MFLQTNERITNLKNVSDINILTKSNRIVFNLNYNIKLHGKMISDYIYWDSDDAKDMSNKLDYLKNDTYFKKNFIDKKDGYGYININCISSIKFNENKNRVIVNLSHTGAYIDNYGNKKITSQFIFVDLKNYDEYVKYVQYIYNKTGITTQGE